MKKWMGVVALAGAAAAAGAWWLRSKQPVSAGADGAAVTLPSAGSDAWPSAGVVVAQPEPVSAAPEPVPASEPESAHEPESESVPAPPRKRRAKKAAEPEASGQLDVLAAEPGEPGSAAS